jgi:Fe2+ or Zn2+ uptake regulation protein
MATFQRSTVSTNAELALQSLRKADVRLTPPRRVVIEVLASQEHLTAPEVVEAVQKRAPAISRASVYRALDLLTRLGICRIATMGLPIVRYTLTPNGNHHHLVCSRCFRAFEFDSCGLSALVPELEARTGFRISGHLLEAYGLCADCQQHGATEE